MKKITPLYISAVIASFVLFGCGSKEESSAPQTVEEAEKAANQAADTNQSELEQAASQAEKEAEEMAKKAEAEARKAIDEINK